jgi:DNA-binding CsgD family transcriptional regulator
VHVSDGLLMTVRAARLDGPGTLLDRDIAVTMEESSAAERVDLFCRAFGFTARERELLGHLVAGNDTREVAQRMFLSQNTVQDHLKSIFAKTASRRRRSLLARALGV